MQSYGEEITIDPFAAIREMRKIEKHLAYEQIVESFDGLSLEEKVDKLIRDYADLIVTLSFNRR